MTRTHKYNDKNHAGLAGGTVLPQEHLPHYFAKNGFADSDPNKTKKNGGGKGNWGGAGQEVVDQPFNLTNARRRSNSSGYTNLKDFKTKFDVNEPEPVFEETLHGPGPDGELDDDVLTKMDTSSSGGSVDEDKAAKDL